MLYLVDRRLAEDRHRAQAAHPASRMMRPRPRSYAPVSDLTRVVKIRVLRCTASQDIKAKPTRSFSYQGCVSSVVVALGGGAASLRHTAALAVFTVLRGSAEIELAGEACRPKGRRCRSR